jgi:hypothetical protein
LRTSFVLILALSNCSHNPTIPVWNGKIYTGDPEQQALVRSQEHEVIPASSEKFRHMKAMTDEDLRSFYQTYVLGCKEWWPNIELKPLAEQPEIKREVEEALKKEAQ